MPPVVRPKPLFFSLLFLTLKTLVPDTGMVPEI